MRHHAPVQAALAILRADRQSLIDCHSVMGRIHTEDEMACQALAQYDEAIKGLEAMQASASLAPIQYDQQALESCDACGWRARIHGDVCLMCEYQRPAAARVPLTFDLVAHLRRQIEFSSRTYGPGDRTDGVCDHIRKELDEVQADAAIGAPTLPEWVDVIILGFDGAWRSGATPEQIVAAIVAKQTKNEGRKWPDWRTAPAGKAIEHDRSGESTGQEGGEA